ncbi:hypothetical protein BDV25DRAFT_145048 [Aspergillus avenaceus]|uniref:Uncharacterized protein n=1 Tax=Aspergillus avenaceus TaxID=36643 RepID=A0A5N6TF58_ASPAV|nr:hypothetical protein BDV25DRAFT_145048 [Aspergillus avenaceus]
MKITLFLLTATSLASARHITRDTPQDLQGRGEAYTDCIMKLTDNAEAKITQNIPDATECIQNFKLDFTDCLQMYTDEAGEERAGHMVNCFNDKRADLGACMKSVGIREDEQAEVFGYLVEDLQDGLSLDPAVGCAGLA